MLQKGVPTSQGVDPRNPKLGLLLGLRLRSGLALE